MNNYLKKWTIYTLLSQKYIFMLMMIQLALATLILALFFSASADIRSHLNELLQEQENIIFAINPVHSEADAFDPNRFDLLEWGRTPIILNEYDNLPINQHDLHHLRQSFPELTINLLVEVNLVVLMENGTIFTIFYDSSLDDAQLTRGFYELLELGSHENIINARDLHFTLDNNQIKSLNGSAYPIEHHGESVDNNMEYIRLPIETYYPFHHPRNVVNTRLQIQLSDTNLRENMQNISYILQYLHEQHGRYFSYYLSSDFAEFFAIVERASSESDAFIIVSLLLLVVVSIGMSASFVTLLGRQKKEISIMLAMGVTKTQLYLVVIIQPIIISSIGALIGLILSASILSMGFQLASTTIYLNIFVLAGLFLFLQILAGVASLPMILKIKKLMPVELLRS